MIKCDFIYEIVIRVFQLSRSNQAQNQNRTSAVFTRRRSLENDLKLVVSSGTGLAENQRSLEETELGSVFL